MTSVNSDDSSEQILQSSRFWIQRVFVPILVCIGVSGNIVTVMILTRKRMRCSTNIYLTALAIADIVYLLFVFTLSFSHYDNIHEMKYILYWRFYGMAHWICDAASSTSVWLTVSFTVERYIAVCHPIKGKVLCTENRAKSIIIIIAILCIVTTASTTFEWELNLVESCTINQTCIEDLSKFGKQSSLSPTSEHLYTGNIAHDVIRGKNHNNINTSSSEYKSIIQDHMIDEIIQKLEPKIRSLLPKNNCTSYPSIIYIPIYTSSTNQTNNNQSKNYSVGVVIDNELNNKGEVNADIIRFERDNDNLEKFTMVTDNNDTTIISKIKAIHANCCMKQIYVGTNITDLAQNETYRSIIQWYSALCFGLIPFLCIAIFNSFLIFAVYRSQTTRRKMTTSPEHVSMSNENRITIMLIGVVILFLICQTPTASLLIFNTFDTDIGDVRKQNIKKILGNVFNFLLTINAACNFILYCVLSKKFRATLIAFFIERGKKNRQHSETLLLASTRTNRNTLCKNGFKRNNTSSEYRTPRNLETQSLTSIPRSKSLMMRPRGKARSSDLNL